MRKKMPILSLIGDEDGMSLAELLGAMVILSIVLPLLIGFIVANAKMIEQNTILTEAISVREEIREWMGYRAQSQDIADLNAYVLANTGHQPSPISLTDPAGIVRASHLILDESGIEKDVLGEPKFDEKVPSNRLIDDDGNPITGPVTRNRSQQVSYKMPGGFPLPKLNISADSKRYVGMYVGPDATQQKVAYAVLVEAAPKQMTTETGAIAENNDAGILVTLRIYNSESGKELTNTQFYWSADY
ncbi:type IV pilus modification PilV family protein [Lactococcus paracarnosus]|uniref:Prepilin-type N-terminal cleavage/methylation domain-containing protein n=1 Tax=Pseudolactococcus paracarnosus TaxID=2749962 RepID=A0ABT0AKZ8_9LACT|nr:hypothetical protein [Lactococcus paracarnosus]MCJ1977233.1 hypothetical protein [Lactococcus paracarnosus]MCJ1983271.1 hypothetical protein [Lactococcus paracarnosus]MCJ1998081.1 hypothetical protein [Lactococcus paracarnosus]